MRKMTFNLTDEQLVEIENVLKMKEKDRKSVV